MLLTCPLNRSFATLVLTHSQLGPHQANSHSNTGTRLDAESCTGLSPHSLQSLFLQKELLPLGAAGFREGRIPDKNEEVAPTPSFLSRRRLSLGHKPAQRRMGPLHTLARAEHAPRSDSVCENSAGGESFVDGWYAGCPMYL